MRIPWNLTFKIGPMFLYGKVGTTVRTARDFQTEHLVQFPSARLNQLLYGEVLVVERVDDFVAVAVCLD